MINNRFSTLTKSERRVAEFVQEHTEVVAVSSLQALAEKCDTSDATVLRFCRSLGYMGFADFKVSLVPDLLRTHKNTYRDIGPNGNADTLKDFLRRRLDQQIDSTLRNCDESVLSVIARHVARADKVVIIGLGGSAGVGQIFCDSLGSLRVFSTFLRDRSLIQNVVPTMTSRDVLIGISHSGETEEVVSAVETARDYGAITIGVTNYAPSALADACQFSLVTGVPANLLGSYSCQARISQLALFEMVLYQLADILAEVDDGDQPN